MGHYSQVREPEGIFSCRHRNSSRLAEEAEDEAWACQVEEESVNDLLTTPDGQLLCQGLDPA